MGAYCSGADQHDLSSVRGTSSHQPGSKIALEFKMHLERLHDDRVNRLPVDGELSDPFDVADFAALILRFGFKRDPQSDRNIPSGLLAQEGPHVDPVLLLTARGHDRHF